MTTGCSGSCCTAAIRGGMTSTQVMGAPGAGQPGGGVGVATGVTGGAAQSASRQPQLIGPQPPNEPLQRQSSSAAHAPAQPMQPPSPLDGQTPLIVGSSQYQHWHTPAHSAGRGAVAAATHQMSAPLRANRDATTASRAGRAFKVRRR